MVGTCSLSPRDPQEEAGGARQDFAPEAGGEQAPGNWRPFLSLIVPARDEVENLPRLHERICAALALRKDWELVLVDDGSVDGTAHAIRALAALDPRVAAVFLARNFGQTAALLAGLGEARGELVVTLDADLQNDPLDIPRLVAALGVHDAVVGFRLRRNDSFVRRVSSRLANAVRNRISGDSIRDTGCSLKVFRTRVLRELPRFEGMHRFLPTLVRYRGGSVIELPVAHHPRLAGRSKYGIRNRAWRAFLDLLAVRWMRGRMLRTEVREVVHAR